MLQGESKYMGVLDFLKHWTVHLKKSTLSSFIFPHRLGYTSNNVYSIWHF